MNPSNTQPPRPNPWVVLAVILGAALILQPTPVQADLGPKPSMEFSFVYEEGIEPVPIVEGQLIECEDAACNTGTPLEEWGPQHFRCDRDTCSSMAYRYAPYHKLIITFEDQTRESNIFTKRAADATFEVTVSESALAVQEKRSLLPNCCSGLMFTLLLESLVAGAYLGLFGLPRATLGWVPLSSLLTLPFVWLVFPLAPLPEATSLGLAEVFAVTTEAGLIHLATRRAIPFKHVAALSLLMNGASFLLGLIL